MIYSETDNKTKKRVDILFDNVQAGIVILDRGYRVLTINKFVEDLLHLKSQKIIGEDAIKVFHERGIICPHCVAELTFETGEFNIITQSWGKKYTELSSYPIKDDEGNVVEVAVFLQDITERVLYQEEIIALYKEVAQTKEYLESFIDNSADAIVTTDLQGIVTSWNKGAEKIYGFTEHEALRTFMPFIPDFLIETEMQYNERIKQGEIIKGIETFRKREDGSMIEVSLTLSPIKDTSGEVIGISGISRDISEKKKLEKELIRRNEELSQLMLISTTMRSTLELNKLLKMVLTAVTIGDGLGFNRALLFSFDEEKGIIKGEMGVGPASPEEAWQIWGRLSHEKKTLQEIFNEIEKNPLKEESFLYRVGKEIEISVYGETALSLAVRGKKAIKIDDAMNNPIADPLIIQRIGSQAYAVVPLIARDKVVGVLWVDNFFNRKPITDEDMRFLNFFSNQIASVIEGAQLFEKISCAESELEDIFDSISDMLYITTEDSTIRNVNKAVLKKLGRTKEEIIGRKCYEVFHNADSPDKRCPHHKAVKTRKAYIEELEDSQSGETFLSSVSPIFDSADNFHGTVHIVRDITELKKLRERLSMAERMAALGEVVAKVAHETRNPLVSIGGFSRRLKKKLDGQLKEYASIINSEVERLETNLKDILSFVKETRIFKEQVDGNDIIKDILSLFSGEIKKKDIILKTELGEHLIIKVDPNRIKEALINIINNAIQVLETKGILKIKTFNNNGFDVIEIEDSGPGIKEKDLSYIFDPFFTTKHDGTGLGLTITHRIIKEHGGRIEVSSSVGNGTIFRVYLPLSKSI